MMTINVYFRIFSVTPIIVIMLLGATYLLNYNLGFNNPTTCYKYEQIKDNPMIIRQGRGISCNSTETKFRYRSHDAVLGKICGEIFYTKATSVSGTTDSESVPQKEINIKAGTSNQIMYNGHIRRGSTGGSMPFNNSLCKTKYNTAECNIFNYTDFNVTGTDSNGKKHEGYLGDDDLIYEQYECRCNMSSSTLGITPKYSGDNCGYESDAYSLGLPTPVLSMFIMGYVVTILTSIGLYKWALLSFRFDSITSTLYWILSADFVFTAWFVYMVFIPIIDEDGENQGFGLGADGLGIAFSGIDQDTSYSNFYEHIVKIVLLWCWIGVHIVFPAFFKYVQNGFAFNIGNVLGSLVFGITTTILGTLILWLYANVRHKGRSSYVWPEFERLVLYLIPICFWLGGILGLIIGIKCLQNSKSRLVRYIKIGFGVFFSLIIGCILLLILSSTQRSLLFWVDVFVGLPCLILVTPVLKNMFSKTDNYHFPENLFPIYYVDAKTDKMVNDDSSTKNVFLILFLGIFYSCIYTIWDNKHESLFHQFLFFICLIVLIVFVMHRHFKTKLTFSESWKQVRVQTALIDRLRSQAIEHEMKDLGGGGQTTESQEDKVLKTYNCSCSLMESSYEELVYLISSQPNHPWELAKQKVQFDTHAACLDAVGQVPALMPPSWQKFMSVAESANIAGKLLDLDADDIKRKNGASFSGIQLGSMSSMRNKLVNGSDSDSSSDSESDDEEDDLPELLVSNAGHSVVDGIYTYIGKKEGVDVNDSTNGFPKFQLVNGELGMGCYITINAIDDGWADSSSGGTLYWVILHGTTVVYRTIHTGPSPTERKKSMERKKLQSIELNKYNTGIFDTKVNVDDEDEDALIMPDQNARWTAVVEDAEPSPSVVSTELNDWQKVYRAGKGIIKFQQSMDRLANEELRLVARFRLLLIRSSISQIKVEGSVLWNFVRSIIPKLEKIVEEERVNAYYQAHSFDDSDDDDEILINIEQIEAGKKKEEEKKEEEKKEDEKESKEVVNPLELANSLPGKNTGLSKMKHAVLGLKTLTKVISANLELSKQVGVGNEISSETIIKLKIIDRYTMDTLTDRQIKYKVLGNETVYSIQDRLRDDWGYKERLQTLLLVHKVSKATTMNTFLFYKSISISKQTPKQCIYKYTNCFLTIFSLSITIYYNLQQSTLPLRRFFLLFLGHVGFRPTIFH